MINSLALIRKPASQIGLPTIGAFREGLVTFDFASPAFVTSRIVG